MKKSVFYALSFTWGLPMTLTGLIVGFVLLCMGYKPTKFGYCYHFEVGEKWGGLSLGFIFITSRSPSDHTKKHEHGHALQNCYFGFLMPFIVNIPSGIRYWYRRLRTKMGLKNTDYDSIWFERDATERGHKFFEE